MIFEACDSYAQCIHAGIAVDFLEILHQVIDRKSHEIDRVS